MTKVLVAGVGNIFLTDDGFGVEVIQQLQTMPVPDGVEVTDFGIRGVHLAYQLLDGYDLLILVDAVPRGNVPGSVSVLEVPRNEPIRGAAEAASIERGDVALVDAHGMEPASVLGMLESVGGLVKRVLVVGCEPVDVSDGIGLTEPVRRAVPEAVRLIGELLAMETTVREGSR